MSGTFKRSFSTGMNGTLPSVEAVILNWNGHEDTEQCLESLQRVTYPALRIAVVDNGSTRPGLDRPMARFPAVRWIRSPRNVGFSAGNNLAIRHSRADYVLLLNNDTVVSPGFLEPLVSALESDARAGAASGTILVHDENPTRRIWYAGGEFTSIPGAFRLSRIGERFETSAPGCVKTQFVSGCLMLIRRQVFSEAGLLDEDFFFSEEDVEFCCRLRSRGYRLLYVPESVIWHYGGRSRLCGAQELLRSYASRLLLVRKLSSRPAFWFWGPVFIGYIAADTLFRGRWTWAKCRLHGWCVLAALGRALLGRFDVSRGLSSPAPPPAYSSTQQRRMRDPAGAGAPPAIMPGPTKRLTPA